MTVSISDLIAQREALERQIQAAQNAAKADAIARVRKLMVEHDFDRSGPGRQVTIEGLCNWRQKGRTKIPRPCIRCCVDRSRVEAEMAGSSDCKREDTAGLRDLAFFFGQDVADSP